MKITAILALLLHSSLALAANPLDGLPPKVVALHEALHGKDACQDDLPYGSETHELGSGNKLYLVPCTMGAYQGSSLGYIETSTGQISPLYVLGYNEITKAIEAQTDMMEATFDAKTKTISTRGRGRGIGDCGQSSETKLIVDKEFSSYVFVKTTEVRAKPHCDGKMNRWPVVFRQ